MSGPTRPTPLWDLVAQRAAARPDVTAVVDVAGTALTYGALAARVRAATTALAEVVRPGDIVNVGDADHADVVTTYLAALALGHVAVDLGPPPPTSDTTMIPQHHGAQPTVAATAAGVRRLTATTAEPEQWGSGAVVVHTSGSTGQPKRTVHPIGALLHGIWNTAAVADEAIGAGQPLGRPSAVGELAAGLADRPPLGLVMCVGLPVRSVGGLSVLNRSLAMGDTVVFPASLAATDVVRAANLGVTNLGMAPFTAQQLCRLASLGEIGRPDGILACGLGSSGVRPDVCEQLETWLGAPVTSGYGTTELGGVALMARPWDPPELRWGTVGRPVPGVAVRLRGDGPASVLEVASPAAMQGLLGDDGTIDPASEWSDTGDLAAIDGDGTVTIAGRADYVITRGGRRIDPCHVEQALEAQPAVRRAGVVGVPSRVAGEHDLVALVELRAPITPAQVRSDCIRRLPRHEVPRVVIEVDAIPLSRDGKPRRHLLPTLVH